MKKIIFVLAVLALFSSIALADSADTVILVSDTTNVDMLIAKAAGEKEGVPVLVLEGGMLTADVKAELTSLGVKTIILVGGPVVIKPEVQTELEASGYNVVRLWGAERTGTALEVASYFWKGGSRCIVLADDTKNSDDDTETQIEATADATVNGCPFVPVPKGMMPTEVLEAIHELNVQEARFVGRIASGEFRSKLAKLRMVEIIGDKDEVEDNIDNETRHRAANESQKIKLVIIAAPNWKDTLGFAGHAGRHTIVRIVSNTSTVPKIIQIINSSNITEVFVVGNPTLAGEIAAQLEAAGIEVKQISGNASEVARRALKETIKKWEERRRHAAGDEALIRQQVKDYLLALLNRTETKLNLLEIELAGLNTSGINQSRIAEIQVKIDNAQSQISAIREYILNGNFDTARTRIAKILDSVNFLRWLHHVELRIDQAKEIEREEDDNDDTENGSDFSELERRLANLKNRCNADSIESLIEKAKTVRAELQQAKAEGDHIKAARLLVEMRGIVEQSKHLSDVCERMSKISTKLENVVAKRVAIIRTGTSTASNTEARMTATIEITSTEFKPNAVTIKKGGNVTWVNKDNNAHWPASARHPTHTVYPGSGIEKCGSGEKIFDACDGLSKDETFVFQFNEIGKWNYHDHLDSSLFGSVTVVE